MKAMYHQHIRRNGYGALGVISCADDAYDSIVNGEADVESSAGREKVATTAANCAAAAACTAAGGAVVSEICGQIGELVAEVLIDVFNDLASSISKFWGGGSDERRARRREMMAAANQNYEAVQDLIWQQWYKSLESTTAVYKKLYGKTLQLETAMWMYAPYIPLDKIPGTNQLRPKYLGDPPKCYPGPGCYTTSSQAGYVFIPANTGTCMKPPTQTINVPGQGTKTITVTGGRTYTAPTCLADQLSAFFYINDKLDDMIEYVEAIVQTEIRVGIRIAQARAEEIAKEEMAKKDAATAARRAKMIADMRAARRRRDLETRKRNLWLAALTQGSWGMLWRPSAR